MPASPEAWRAYLMAFDAANRAHDEHEADELGSFCQALLEDVLTEAGLSTRPRPARAPLSRNH